MNSFGSGVLLVLLVTLAGSGSFAQTAQCLSTCEQLCTATKDACKGGSVCETAFNDCVQFCEQDCICIEKCETQCDTELASCNLAANSTADSAICFARNLTCYAGCDVRCTVREQAEAVQATAVKARSFVNNAVQNGLNLFNSPNGPGGKIAEAAKNYGGQIAQVANQDGSQIADAARKEFLLESQLAMAEAMKLMTELEGISAKLTSSRGESVANITAFLQDFLGRLSEALSGFIQVLRNTLTV